MQPQHSAAQGHNVVDRLLDAVRGAFPDMADIVASTLRLQFGAVLLDTLADAQRFQFLTLAADEQEGPESAAMNAVPIDEMDRIESSGAAPSVIMRAGLDRAMEIYGTPVPDVDAGRRVWLDKLDIALNGAAGATGASLVDLVEQVERQQRAVHIVNFDDGMVLNFRAPDGRRATLTLSTLFAEVDDGHGHPYNTARAAIASYPSVGPRVPVRS
jgi:hypothetical protein